MTLLPALAASLLRALLHDAERDEIMADVAAEFDARASRDGVASARAWLWRQVLGSIPGVLDRGWFRGTTGFESEANRMRRGGGGLESWLMDARFALRGMRSRPQYMLLSVLALALGIGGTTAIFGIARAILLEPLPYSAPDELVMFWNKFDWSEAEMVYLGDDWPGLTDVAAFTTDGVFLKQEGSPAQLISGLATSSALFDVLGTRPAIGSGFAPDADVIGAEPSAVLSHSLWQELGADPSIVGTLVTLDGTPRRIVGVMPAGFWFPDPSVRIWLSTPMRPDNGSGNYALVGRLESGRTIASMPDALNRITTRLREQFTYSEQWDKTRNPVLTPLRDDIVGPVRTPLLATLAGMAVILLMSCANVATLMLGQLRGRSSELAVRLALGAGRRRLTQQLLVESAMLGVVAGLAGALVALAAFRILLAALPLGELANAVRADWTLFGFAMLIAFGAALLIALAPVFSLWRGDLRDALQRARSGGIGARGGRLEDMLVIGEVALAVILAAGAAVLIRSVGNMQRLDSGLDPRGVAVIDVTSSADIPQEQRRAQIGEMVEALRAQAGVRAVAATQRLPLRGGGDNWGIAIQEQPDREPSTTAYRIITHDFFDVMGVELKSGRVFDETDRTDGELVAVIDEALAEKYFPGEDPIGKMIGSGTGQGWARIIGVVENVAHTGLTDEKTPGRYMLFDQLNYTPEGIALVIVTEGRRNAGSVIPTAIRTIETTMGSVAVRDATTMENVVALAMGPTRRIMQLMSLLGALALALGAIGVYGVVSHFVNRRRRDWVIRMALGMKPGAVLQQVVGRGALLVATGCVIGLLTSLALTRVFRSLLYDVSAADPLALISAAVALVVTGCIAAAVPGRRASRTNPAAVLRDS